MVWQRSILSGQPLPVQVVLVDLKLAGTQVRPRVGKQAWVQAEADSAQSKRVGGTAGCHPALPRQLQQRGAQLTKRAEARERVLADLWV